MITPLGLSLYRELLPMVKKLCSIFGYLGLIPACLWGISSWRRRQDLSDRLVLGDWRKFKSESFQGVEDDKAHRKAKRIWFHAASVGEVGALFQVFKLVREQFSDVEIFVTTTSQTGKSRVLKEVQVDGVCLLPFDVPVLMRKAIKRIEPDLVLSSETELWPNLFFALEDARIPLLLVNARISDYSFPMYLKFRGIFTRMLQVPLKILAQTAVDAERYSSLGAKDVVVAGSSKYENPPSRFSKEEKKAYFEELGLDNKAPCIVAGSVRPIEDEIVIRAYLNARARIPSLQMVIAPRHPEDFEKVGLMLERFGIQFTRRSDWKTGFTSGELCSVVLLDTIGELSKAYAVGTMAFVGATLVDIGGHNPLEPASYSVPVIVGPYTSNVRGAVAELKRKNAVLEVSNVDSLSDAFVKFASDEIFRVQSGQGAHSVWNSFQGASARIMDEVVGLFSPVGQERVRL